MSGDSILVSWKPPTEPNGIIEYYMVYYKEVDGTETKPKSQKIVPNLKNQNLSYQAKNLDSNLKYEFWVTAFTTIGEGQPSKKITVSPSTSGKWAIYLSLIYINMKSIFFWISSIFQYSFICYLIV